MPDSKPRVLVVDDDRAVRDSLRRSLEFNGYDVALASDGAEALATVGGVHPDVVVMDVMMPRLDGIESTRALRAAGNEVRFGFVTSESTDAMRATAEQAGALFLIGKPFTAETFAEQLGAVLV